MHRFILNLSGKTGTDHKDLNKLNNQKYNLRPCNKSQNRSNTKKQKGNYSSKYKGVCWNNAMNGWQAQIKVMGNTKYLGCFAGEWQAAQIYNKAAIKYFGNFALLNEE